MRGALRRPARSSASGERALRAYTGPVLRALLTEMRRAARERGLPVLGWSVVAALMMPFFCCLLGIPVATYCLHRGLRAALGVDEDARRPRWSELLALGAPLASAACLFLSTLAVEPLGESTLRDVLALPIALGLAALTGTPLLTLALGAAESLPLAASIERAAAITAARRGAAALVGVGAAVALLAPPMIVGASISLLAPWPLRDELAPWCVWVAIALGLALQTLWLAASYRSVARTAPAGIATSARILRVALLPVPAFALVALVMGASALMPAPAWQEAPAWRSDARWTVARVAGLPPRGSEPGAAIQYETGNAHGLRFEVADGARTALTVRTADGGGAGEVRFGRWIEAIVVRPTEDGGYLVVGAGTQGDERMIEVDASGVRRDDGALARIRARTGPVTLWLLCASLIALAGSMRRAMRSIGDAALLDAPGREASAPLVVIEARLRLPDPSTTVTIEGRTAELPDCSSLELEGGQTLRLPPGRTRLLVTSPTGALGDHDAVFVIAPPRALAPTGLRDAAALPRDARLGVGAIAQAREALVMEAARAIPWLGLPAAVGALLVALSIVVALLP